MTTEEKRTRMTAMCRIGNRAPYNDCKQCEICDACSTHSPMMASDEEIKAIFADLIRRGDFKEE